MVKHKPTDETKSRVADLAAFGIPHPEIASLIGISEPTLNKYYRIELDTGRAAMNEKVAKALCAKALDGDVASMIFYLKTRARWHETQIIEQTVTSSQSLKIESIDPAEASREYQKIMGND